MLRSNSARRHGAAAIEYAVLLSAIIGAGGVGVALVGSSARDQFARTGTATAPGQGGVPGGGSGPPAPPEKPFHPLHDNFNGKGNMKWRDVAGDWKTDDGAMSSTDPWAATIADVDGADYTYKVTLRTTASDGKEIWDTTHVVFRYQDAQNYYAVVTKTDGVIELAKMQNGAWQPWLAYANSKTDPFKANDYQVRVAGSSIEVKVNGKTTVRYTDPNPIATGGVGAANNGSSGRVTKVSVTPNNSGN